MARTDLHDPVPIAINVGPSSRAGEGIAQAIEYGALIGRFIADVLAGRASVDAWTGVVQRSRLGRDLALRALLTGLAYG